MGLLYHFVNLPHVTLDHFLLSSVHHSHFAACDFQLDNWISLFFWKQNIEQNLKLWAYICEMCFCGYTKYTATATGCKETLGCVMALLTIKPYLHAIYPWPAVTSFHSLCKAKPRFPASRCFLYTDICRNELILSVLSLWKKKKVLEDINCFYVARIWSWDFHDELSQLCHDILTEKDVSKS